MQHGAAPAVLNCWSPLEPPRSTTEHFLLPPEDGVEHQLVALGIVVNELLAIDIAKQVKVPYADDRPMHDRVVLGIGPLYGSQKLRLVVEVGINYVHGAGGVWRDPIMVPLPPLLRDPDVVPGARSLRTVFGRDRTTLRTICPAPQGKWPGISPAQPGPPPAPPAQPAPAQEPLVAEVAQQAPQPPPPPAPPDQVPPQQLADVVVNAGLGAPRAGAQQDLQPEQKQEPG
eukprot:jgi/Chlat1/1162/Chrsp112S01628